MSMRDKWWGRVLINVFVFIIGCFIAFILLVGVYALPTDKVEEHVKYSLKVFTYEGDYWQQIAQNSSTRLENFTDSGYVQLCFIKGSDSVIDNALSGYVVANVEENSLPVKNMAVYFAGANTDVAPNKARFWNGYVVPLKLGLILCTYANIRFLDITLNLLMSIWVMFLLYTRLGKPYAIAFFLSWIVQNPTVIAFNIFYSGIWYTTLIPMIVMLYRNKKIRDKRQCSTFFMLVGMATMYFNENSSLCMPVAMCMILYFALNGYEGNFISQLKKIIVYGFAWGVGCYGLCVVKWVLASVLTDNYSLVAAMETVLFRTGTSVPDGEITRMQAIQRNIDVMKENKWALLFVMTFLVICLGIGTYRLLKSKNNNEVVMADENEIRTIGRQKLYALVWTAIFVAVPFFWYCFMPNHSYIHNHFTYRTLAIAVMSLCFEAARVSGFGGIRENVERK